MAETLDSMQLASLRLQNFRNHLHSWFEFGPGTNLLVGDNGQGKTNVIEAISYICLTKSFYASTDMVVLNFDQSVFEVDGTLRSDTGTESRVRVVYDRQVPRKAYFINNRAVEPFSSVIGKFPVVVCSPEHAPVTMGSPHERRRFIDLVISQSSEPYFKTLLEYRHALKQRNKVLLDSKLSGRGETSDLVEPWTQQLIALGGTLMSWRSRFVVEFLPFIETSYRRLVESEELPHMKYVPAVTAGDYSSEEGYREALAAALQLKAAEERRVGTTLAGPHRDEYAFTINHLDLRGYASQGQHKTFLIALKLAEFFYLKDRCRETPVLLLDDVFSELDERRTGRLLEFVGSISQTFVTSTGLQAAGRSIDFSGPNKKFQISSGAVLREQAAAS